MDVKQKAAAPARIYQDFEPPTELLSENDSDTLLVYVPGFRKEQLRVQLSNTRELIISGERLVGDNTWQRFRKTVAVSPNCDMDKITAKFKFEDQILYIIQPKLITSEKKQDHEKLITGGQTPEPQKFSDEKKHPDNVNDESRQKPTIVTNPEFSTYQTGETALKKVKEEVSNDESGESSDYEPDNVNDESRQKPTIVTNPEFSTYQTGDTAANGETALKKVKEEVSNDESGESSDYEPWEPRHNVEDALDKATTNKKNDGYVAEDDKMKGTTNQNHEPESDSFICKMDETAGKGLGLATKMKMPGQVINLVLAVLLAIAIGLYVKNSASFWKKDEN